MAVVWCKTLSGVCYEVRSAGRSVRLYTDGVFHSQYNPGQLLTGHVWDLLMLPAFFYPKQSIKRVLVLGVGGGAAIHMLREFVEPEQITGIEFNPVHIRLGKRFFNLSHASTTLIEADAITWLKQYQGEKFDMIIDDVFAEKDGEPVAVQAANRSWFTIMLKHLSRDGLIVRNFINRKELLASAGVANQAIASKFASVFQLTSHYNENFVVAYLRQSSSQAYLREQLRSTPGLNPDLKTSKLRFRIKRLA